MRTGEGMKMSRDSLFCQEPDEWPYIDEPEVEEEEDEEEDEPEEE